MEVDINKFKAIAVLGNTGSGKTAYVFKMLEKANRPVYFIKHPKPELLKPFGYSNLDSLEDISRLNNVIIYFDEPQLYTNCSDYKRDQILIKILSLARQRDITLIISSADTRTFSKRVEAFFDLWIVKDVEYELTKQRSMVRNILNRYALMTPHEITLMPNEYLAHCKSYPVINGRHDFELIAQWSEQLSKPYGIFNNASNELAKLIKNGEKKNESFEITAQTAQTTQNSIFKPNNSQNMENSVATTSTEVANLDSANHNLLNTYENKPQNLENKHDNLPDRVTMGGKK